MTPRELIAEAWHITTEHKRKLLPWGAADAFILMIAAMSFMSYQMYVLGTFFRTGEIVSWRTVITNIAEFLDNSPTLIGILIAFTVIYGILWVLIPRLATGALIGLAAKIHCGDKPKGSLVLAVFNFVHLLELSAALVLIEGKTLFSFWSLLIRYMGAADAIFSTSAVLIIIWCVSFVFHFLFMFSEEAIVIRKMGVFRSIGHSFKLVISYLSKVVLIGILLLVIILRIIINAVIIFLIPSIVMGLGLLLARFIPHLVSFGISGSIGLVGMLFASYFLGYVTVFKHTVWTITYIELSKLKELDIIEAPGEGGEGKEGDEGKESNVGAESFSAHSDEVRDQTPGDQRPESQQGDAEIIEP